MSRFRDKDGEIKHQLDPLPAHGRDGAPLQAAQPQGPRRGRQGRRQQHHRRARSTSSELNGHGRRLRVHGVNLSVGYDFEPEWFACGQSPLCVEVDRLVRSGVVVVVAAGNTGYGYVQTRAIAAPSPAGWT